MKPRPTVLVAMPADLVARFFPQPILHRLEAVAGPVSYAVAPAGAGPLAAAEVLVTGWGTPPIDAGLLDAAPRLEAIVHTAGSVRRLVGRDVYDRGIVVSSQAVHNALPVAEYSLAMILLAAKGVLPAQAVYRERRGPVDLHATFDGAGTYRRRVGVIGASTIGRRVVELLRPFDLEVVVADPFLDHDEADRLGVERVDLPTLMATSAVVSLHAPLLPSTVGMIDAALLAQMGDGATFVNTARGAIVDQDALVAELRTGRLHAVLDVTDPEPPEAASPLWNLPNVVLTPHVAGALGTELWRMGESAVAEIARLAAGEALLHGVSAEEYDRRA